MACKNEIHENDIGTEFIVTITECINGTDVPLDISTATLKQIVFTKSDKTKVVFPAVWTPISSGGTGNGSDGQISYTTVSGDLTPMGSFKIQGIVTTPFGQWSSTIDKFKVEKNL